VKPSARAALVVGVAAFLLYLPALLSAAHSPIACAHCQS